MQVVRIRWGRAFSTEIVVMWILLYLCMKIFGFLITWSLSICFYPLQNERMLFFYPYVGQCRPRWRSSDERWSHMSLFCCQLFFFFLIIRGCSSQLTRTTTNPQTHWTPCKPSRQVRHRGDDRRAHWDLNLGCIGREIVSRPLGYKPRCLLSTFESIG